MTESKAAHAARVAKAAPAPTADEVVPDDRAELRAVADAHAETQRDTKRGYRVKHVQPGDVPYYETLEGSYGSFDEETMRAHVASVCLLANNLIG